MILSDAELILGLSRHLGAYARSAETASLDTLQAAGWIVDMAFRLRGNTSSTPDRVWAIGMDIGLGQRDLQFVIAKMEALGWLAVDRDQQRKPLSVIEAIPAPADLVKATPKILQACDANPSDYALLELLRATTLQPLLLTEALAVAAQGTSEQSANDAVRRLLAVGLLRDVQTDSGRVLYNPNVWTQGDEIAKAAIRTADAKATSEVRALLEELAEQPGLPEANVKSTEPRWINFAVAQGLIQRSVIQTSEGDEQGFLFTPHLLRDPFGGTAGDASGQVRQLVGSMVYAATFARYKLKDPGLFLTRLIENGLAGDVTSIGTDYPMLEKAGIVKVVPGSRVNRFRLELLRADVAEEAAKLLTVRGNSSGSNDDIAAVRAQRAYVHVERQRARLAVSAEADDVEQQRLLAALREVTAERTFRGGN